jgi:hypothetical protein
MPQSFLFGPESQTERATVYDVPATREDYLSSIYEQSTEETPTNLIKSYLSKPKQGGNWYTKEEAESLSKEYQIPMHIPDGGIDADNFAYNLARQKQRQERQQVIERQPDGFTTSALGIGAMLAPQIADPINLATGLIPIVGPARYSALVGASKSALGRFGVRAGVAGAEAGVGSALIEPINYATARALGDDYDAYDSFMNISFGIGFGSAIGSGGGLLVDALGKGSGAIQAIPKAERADIVQAAAERMLRDGSVDISPVINASVKRRFLYGVSEIATTPGLIDRIGKESPYEISYEKAKKDVLSNDIDLSVKLNILEKELATGKKLNRYELALIEYDRLKNISDDTPESLSLKAKEKAKIDEKYGAGFNAEANQYLIYKELADQLLVKSNAKKVKKITTLMKEVASPFKGRLESAYKNNKGIDVNSTNIEIAQLKLALDDSAKLRMFDMKKEADASYQRTADEFSRGSENLEYVRAVNELRPINDELATIKPDTIDNRASELDEEIGFFKSISDEFEQRYPDVKFDDIDDAEFDFKEIVNAAKNYANCLVR